MAIASVFVVVVVVVVGCLFYVRAGVVEMWKMRMTS